MNNLVNLKYLDDYSIKNLETSISEGINRLNLSNKFTPKSKVLIKVCMPYATSPDKAESTHPEIVRAVVNYLTKLGVTCVVADSPYGKFNVSNLNSAYLNTGMLEMANVTTCELNRNLSTVDISYPNGVMTKNFKVLDVINQVDAVINIGKLRIDDNLDYLGATANMFGLIPGEMKTMLLNRMSTLKDFNNYILDVYDALKNKIQLNILDAIVALEANKTQRMLNCLAMSENAYSIDAVMFDVLAMPYKNTFLKQAEERGLFETDKPYKIVGDKLDLFKVEDFSLKDFDEQTCINQTSSVHFKTHQQRVFIDKNKCKGCRICSKICPTGAITMKCDNNGELFSTIDYKKCIYCNKCVTACPYSVVDIKTPLKYKSLIKEIEKYNKK